jgi:uncharacterized protein (AIM24 family)
VTGASHVAEYLPAISYRKADEIDIQALPLPCNIAFVVDSGSFLALSDSSSITYSSSTSTAFKKLGPFALPALPGFIALTAPSVSRVGHGLVLTLSML